MLRSTSAVLFLLILCTPAAAQSTRVEAIAEEQKKKAGNLGAEGPSNAEQIIRRVLISPLLAGGDGPYPWFGSVFPGTGMAVGGGAQSPLPLPSMAVSEYIKVDISAIGGPDAWTRPVSAYFRRQAGRFTLVGLERLP